MEALLSLIELISGYMAGTIKGGKKAASLLKARKVLRKSNNIRVGTVMNHAGRTVVRGTTQKLKLIVKTSDGTEGGYLQCLLLGGTRGAKLPG